MLKRNPSHNDVRKYLGLAEKDKSIDTDDQWADFCRLGREVYHEAGVEPNVLWINLPAETKIASRKRFLQEWTKKGLDWDVDKLRFAIDWRLSMEHKNKREHRAREARQQKAGDASVVNTANSSS